VTQHLPRPIAALAAVVVLVVAACGTNNGGGNAGASNGAGSSEAIQASQAPAVSVNPQALTGNLTVWAMGNEGTKLSTLADDFMKQYPGVKVSVTPVDWGQAVTKLQTAIGGKQTPDVSQMGTDMMGQFAQTGALEAIPANFDKSQFFESAWNTGVVDGTAYGVPWYVETRALYWRKDIAQKAGITAAPTNWDELTAAAKAMQSKGGAKYGIGLGTKNWQELMPFVWSNGGDIMDSSGNFTFDTPQFIEALTTYKSFFDQGLAPKNVPEGFDITPAFVSGTHPMFFSGPWHISLLDQAGGSGFQDKYEVSPMPGKTQAPGTSFIGGSNLVVFKDSPNKDAAWAFVQYLSQPDVQGKWYSTVSDLPAVKSAWDDAALKDDPRVDVFRTQLDTTKAQPAIPTWSEVSTAINDELEKVTTGNESPEDAAKALQQKATSIGTGG
jgi:multiple sugar transport system substrate-binding protein